MSALDDLARLGDVQRAAQKMIKDGTLHHAMRAAWAEGATQQEVMVASGYTTIEQVRTILGETKRVREADAALLDVDLQLALAHADLDEARTTELERALSMPPGPRESAGKARLLATLSDVERRGIEEAVGAAEIATWRAAYQRARELGPG